MRYLSMTALLLMSAAPAISAANAAPARAAPTKDQIQSAEQTLGIIVSGLQSDKVPADVKSALFGCIYEHPLADISDRATKVLDENKKLDGNDPTTRLTVVAGVCGANAHKPATKGR